MKDTILDYYDEMEVTKKEWCFITAIAFLLGILIGIALAPMKNGLTVKFGSDNSWVIGNSNNKVKGDCGKNKKNKKHKCCK